MNPIDAAEIERVRKQVRVRGIESLNSLDLWRLQGAEHAEQCEQADRERRDEEQRAQQAIVVTEEAASERAVILGDVETMRDELDGLRQEVATSLRAVRDGFDLVERTASEQAAEYAGRCRALEDEIAALHGELLAARAGAVEQLAASAKEAIDERAAMRASLEQIAAEASRRTAEQVETVRGVQNDLSLVRSELAVLRSAGAEQLSVAAKAVLDNLNEAAAQRAAVNRLIETTREELDGLNARTASLMADVRELKDAAKDFKFSRE